MMMPASPWILSTRVELTGDYLVLVSEFPLRQYSSTPAFIRMVLQIRKQLADAWVSSVSDLTPAARRRYRTVSAREDRDALYRFVGAQPHSSVMARLGPKMGDTRFTTWHMKGAKLPPSWPDARPARHQRRHVVQLNKSVYSSDGLQAVSESVREKRRGNVT
jgi:hypothetical protein